MNISTEEKAEAFDALCKEMQGKHRLVGEKSAPVRRPYWETFGENNISMKVLRIPVFQWTLRSDGVEDFELAVIKLARERRKIP